MRITNADLRSFYTARMSSVTHQFVDRSQSIILQKAEQGYTSVHIKLRDDELVVTREIDKNIQTMMRVLFPELHIASTHTHDYTLYIFSWKH